MLYLSDPISTPVSCGSDSFEFFDVKWFLCACKLCPEIQPPIRRVLTRPHSLPSVLQPAVPGHDRIQLTLVHEVWLSSHLFFSLHIKRSPSFGPGSKTRRVRTVFVLSQQNPPSVIFFSWGCDGRFCNLHGQQLWLWWYLYCMRPSMLKCIWNVFGNLSFIYWNAYEPYMWLKCYIVIYFRESGLFDWLVN